MTHVDFLTVNEVLSEILQYTNDKDTLRYSKGVYYSWIERALTDLAYNTYYGKRTCDIKINAKRLAIDIPEGLFNIKEVYAFTPDKEGQFCNSVIVHNKRLYNNRGKGRSYTAKVRISGPDENVNGDPYYHNYNPNGYENIYFYNVHGREMQLSSNLVNNQLNNTGNANLSVSFTHIRIVANTTGVEKLGDAPIVLMVLREPVIAFVCEQFFASEKSKDRSYRTDWADWIALRKERFLQAETRLNRMDTAAKEDLYNYMSSLGIDNQW